MSSDWQVTRCSGFDMQVCVNYDAKDENIVAFAEQQNPCGTESGWHIRREGDKSLQGAKERVECRSRPGFVHIMLDA